MTHICYQPLHIISDKIPYQFFHAVMNSITANPTESSNYSNYFHMHKKRGTFYGIDTRSVKKFGKLNFTSKISAGTKTISLCNHPNINDLLHELVQEKVLSNYGANS